MASPKHKTRSLREKPNGIAPRPPAGFAPSLPEPPAHFEQKTDEGSRFPFALWLVAFGFLASLLLWDLLTALLFR
jgi:hypothetical protein